MSRVPDATLDNPQQIIADLRRANAELQQRLDARTIEHNEALQRETATAEVLQVINSSPGDLAPVFDAMLEKAVRLCESAFGILRTWDGERLHFAAAYGDSRFTEWSRERRPFTPENPASPLGRIVRGELVVTMADAPREASYPTSPGFRALTEASGMRTGIHVALRKDGALLGIVTVYRQEVRPYSDQQVTLLQNFAAQAVIAMENARLIAETREALEQQTATAEVLQVINSSPGDLTPVFDAMLEKARVLCGFAHGTFNIYDGEYFRSVAFHGIPETFAEVLRQPRRTGSNFERLLRGERVVHIADITEREFSSDDPIHRAAVDAGIRTVLFVPLRIDGALLGYITANRREVRPFTDKQIALLQNFAAQAVIAMENARLITETREALEQQTATAEVLQVINSSPGDLGPVLDAMLEKALHLCSAAIGILNLYDGTHVRIVAHRGLSQDYAQFLSGTPHQPGTSGPLAAFLRGEPFVHWDAAESQSYREGHPLARALVEMEGGRTLLAVPLRKDAVVVGMFIVYRREVRLFGDKQIALLQNFAAQAVIAMENARLLTETREALEQQTATAEVLQVINSSPGDLAPVFDTMLAKATRLCEASCGQLATYDGQFFRFVAVHGDAGFVEAQRVRGPLSPDLGGTWARIVGGENVVHISDLRDTDLYRDGHEGARRLVDGGGGRTLLTLAMRKDDKLLGVLAVYRQEVRPFTDKHIALLQNFASQAVIAMENARLLGELQQRNDEIAGWNHELEARVAEQVEELGRVGRLKRFLAPQLAELIVSQGDEKVLESHRREIVVVFCDLRGYTAFTETAEPEEVLEFLREYHGALGPLVSQFEGTLDQFSGDGIMVFFNDPVPCADPAERAVKMALAMREAAGKLIANWRRHGGELGFGVGIAQGFATLGQIGFADRSGYTAIGTVCNLAARLCAEAKDGQILISSRVAEAVEAVAQLQGLGNLDLKGLRRPVAAFNVGEQVSDTSGCP
jgi:GAF domain-containing protein